MFAPFWHDRLVAERVSPQIRMRHSMNAAPRYNAKITEKVQVETSSGIEPDAAKYVLKGIEPKASEGRQVTESVPIRPEIRQSKR